jgi:hypothetical protein
MCEPHILPSQFNFCKGETLRGYHDSFAGDPKRLISLLHPQKALPPMDMSHTNICCPLIKPVLLVQHCVQPTHRRAAAIDAAAYRSACRGACAVAEGLGHQSSQPTQSLGASSTTQRVWADGATHGSRSKILHIHPSCRHASKGFIKTAAAAGDIRLRSLLAGKTRSSLPRQQLGVCTITGSLRKPAGLASVEPFLLSERELIQHHDVIVEVQSPTFTATQSVFLHGFGILGPFCAGFPFLQ